MTMATVTLLLLVCIPVIGILYWWYEPEVEVIELTRRYKVFLWYNKWDGDIYVGRKRASLFTVWKRN